MFLTKEKLLELNACGPGLKYFQRFYPDGVELIEIIKDRHMQKSFLHWGREKLTITEEEEEAYCKACKIVNSSNYWHSTNITNSKNIVNSKKIEDSERIYDSSDVIKSFDVSSSKKVNDSSQIFISDIVDSSKKILKSKNIIKSINVCESIMIVNSKNILRSTDVLNSSEIINGTSVTDSFFCLDCRNISNCLFCKNLDSVEYYIFNKPVDKVRFNIIKEQYFRYFKEMLSFVKNWPENLTKNTKVICKENIKEWYSSINQDFWNWVSSLPNFDPFLLYNLTYNENFLKKE